MRRLLIIFLILLPTLVFGQNFKPMLGTQIDKAHQLGDPVAAWFFLEGSGNKVFDLSGNNITGTINGAVWKPGKFGSCLDFTGATTDNIDITGFTSMSQTYSFSMWVNSSKAATTGDFLFDTESGRFVLQWFGDVSGKIGFYDGADRGFGDAPNDGLWHHLVFAFNASTSLADLYIDGIKFGSSLAYVAKDIGGATRICSRYNEALNTGFDGLLSDFLIYERILSASEIAELYIRSFCMFEEDDIGLMAKAAEAPTGGQVIYINFSMIPLFLIFLVCFVKRRKFGR